MAISAVCRLVQPESGQHGKSRESALTAVRRVVSMPPLPMPSHGFHRYTAAPISRSPCARPEAVSRKHLGVISKRNRSWGHQEHTPRALHPASGHPARFSAVQAVWAIACSLHLPLSTLDRDAARTRPVCPRVVRVRWRCRSASIESGVQPHLLPRTRSVLILRLEIPFDLRGPKRGFVLGRVPKRGTLRAHLHREIGG